MLKKKIFGVVALLVLALVLVSVSGSNMNLENNEALDKLLSEDEEKTVPKKLSNPENIDDKLIVEIDKDTFAVYRLDRVFRKSQEELIVRENQRIIREVEQRVCADNKEYYDCVKKKEQELLLLEHELVEAGSNLELIE